MKLRVDKLNERGDFVGNLETIQGFAKVPYVNVILIFYR
mgnify:CR=1 FL=1